MIPMHIEADEIDLEDVLLEDRIVVAERLDVLFDTNATSANTMALATGIDCSSWRSATLVALLHAGGSTWSTPSTTIEVFVETIGLVPEAPGTVFVGPMVALATFDNSSVAPALSLGPWTGAWSSRARVMLRFLQEESAGTEPLTATISVYLVGRRQRACAEAAALALSR